MKRKILIFGQPRSGTNHISALLHYQDSFFSFAERVKYPKKINKNTFGSGEKLKFNSSKFLVWNKVDLKKSKYFSDGGIIYKKGVEPLKPESFDKKERYIFLFRHPNIVHNSMKTMPKFPSNNTLKNIINYYKKNESIIDELKTKNFKVYRLVFEKLLLDPKNEIVSILNWLESPPNKIKTAEDYFQENEYPIGYGGYDPTRILTFEDEKNKIKNIPADERQDEYTQNYEEKLFSYE